MTSTITLPPLRDDGRAVPHPTCPPLRTAVLVHDELARRGLLEVLRAQQGIVVDSGPGDEPRLRGLAARGELDMVVVEVGSGAAESDGALDITSAVDLKRRHPRLSVVLLARDLTDEEALGAVHGGVDALVWRSSPVEALLAVVAQVRGGSPGLDPHFAGVLIRALRGQGRAHGAGLTGREREVLTLVALGDRNLTIARSLFITESTVKFHLRNITDKLGAASRAEVVAIAVRLGLT